MSSQINCDRCGVSNPFGRVFCIKCGAKLDFAAMERKIRRGSQGGGAGHLFFRLVRLLIVAALLAALGLIVWPVSPSGQVGETGTAAQFRANLQALETALDGGTSASVEISEESANAHLLEIVHYTQSEPTPGNRLNLDGMNLRFGEGTFVLVVQASKGPVKLTYEITGMPGADGLEIRGARWGHLPLPLPAARWMTRKLTLLFQNMKREQAVLARVEYKMVDGKLYLRTVR